MPKTIEQIESDLDYSRNALARRKMAADESHDPASLLLWQGALDNADILLETVKRLANDGAMYQQALVNENERRLESQRGREAIEAENARLQRENGRLHQVLLDVSPRDYHIFRQERIQAQQ